MLSRDFSEGYFVERNLIDGEPETRNGSKRSSYKRRHPVKRREIAKNETDSHPDGRPESGSGSENGKRHLIAMKAYELYEQRGRMDGHDLDDWFNAEAIVKSRTNETEA